MTLVGPSWIGRTLGGRYEIESILGRGGMSSVYRATDPNLRRKVAVKIIHQHLSDNKEFIERFEQEAAVIAQLRHPNIVQVHDFNHEGEVYFMVMEYVPGETLGKRLEALKGAGLRLPLNDTIRILTTICGAVDYAHQRRMIHRDLKPANVMINLLNEPVLMDFGIAKIVGGRSHTATGAAMGTAAYMSPEQVRGEHADHRSDIYSLGIMMYEMLSGETPFHGDSTYQIMLKHINEPLPDIQLVEANTPNSLVNILERALSKNPDHRFQTAQEMAAALNTAAMQMPSPTDTLAARHLDRLMVMWQSARDLYDDREFARCLDKLDELHRADPDYQEQKSKQLRQQAIDHLIERANRTLESGEFSESLTAVKALRERDITHPDLDELETKARAGLETMALQAQLNQLYEEALAHLDNREYQSALAKWDVIEQRRGKLPFADRLAVQKRANEGICATLYNQAIAALAQNNPEQTLAIWEKISATDSEFPDSQNVVQSAEAMIQGQNRKKLRTPLFIIGGVALLALLIWGASQFIGGSDDVAETAVPTTIPAIAANTETPTATTMPTETATNPPTATATDAPTDTAVPTNTASPTPELTPSATPLPQDTAVATENASIFAQASTNSNELGIVRAEEMVTVLGRSANNNWLYVLDDSGNRGFIFADLLTWAGDVEALPIRTGSTTIPDATAVPTTDGTLTLDIYQLDGTEQCGEGSSWTQQVFMRAQGVSGTFDYYWEGELIGTAVNDNITFEISSSGGAVVGTGSVIVNGAEVSQQIFVPPPACSQN
ncbi:protein kinase domain-containing protein [Candidatus Leptofilum sp.]|uniref:serine/threonine protein kinase n=1 Tax=Candidatus Leptofilum sp. TaxID=3241576 RepID=UPI003B592F52